MYDLSEKASFATQVLGAWTTSGVTSIDPTFYDATAFDPCRELSCVANAVSEPER